jgi:hypothetical protein
MTSPSPARRLRCHFLVLLAYISSYASFKYNLFNCRGYDAWEVDYNPTSLQQSHNRMQDWLHAWQHSAWRCHTYGHEEWVSQYGIGNGILRAVSLIERSIEFGLIYRPMRPWKWASNANNCTYNMTSLDCYLTELSSCGLNLTTASGTGTAAILLRDAQPMNRDDRVTELGRLLAEKGNATNICIIAQTLKKSMAWVAGQYLVYLLRPRDHIQQQIDQRIHGIFNTIDRTRYSTITVHYRGGKPDAYRKVFSLDVYMTAVKQKAEDLALAGRPVAVVYLASQNNIQIFRSPEYMHEKYGGNYSYKFLYPMSDNTTINANEEIELQFDSNPHIPKEPVVVEFLADLQLMADADVFIGSLSCIYWVTMLFRYAKNPNLNKMHSCFFDRDSKLICENDFNRKIELFNRLDYWITGDLYSPKGLAETHIGAFEGGVPF